MRHLVRLRVPAGVALMAAIAAELLYIGGRVVILKMVPEKIPGEVALTAWRLASLGFYAWLFWEPLKDAWRAAPRRPVHPLLWFAIVLEVGIALAAGYWQDHAAAVKVVFALTTPVIALREEIFYRFILQDGLERRMHAMGAILLSSVAFIVYHAGYQPLNLPGLLMLGAAGLLMGIIYQRTRSLRFVVALHLAIDLAFLVSMNVLTPGWVLVGYFVIILAALLAWSMDHTRERMGL